MTATPTVFKPNVKNISEKFKILYNLPKGTNIIVCIGGRGGMKTYEVSRFIAFSACTQKQRCVVLRDEKALIRESILNEILMRFDAANESTGGVFDKLFSRLDNGIKEKESGEMLVFAKGFRASSNEKAANMKSVSNIDLAVIEEAEDIRDENKYNIFADSIRKEGSVIIIVLNTPDINHWIVKRYFNTINVKDEDGFFELVPKKLDGFVCIQTSFEDNQHLPKHIVNNYHGYGDPLHHLYNKFYYLTAIKGYSSTGRKGQVYTKFKTIKLADYLALNIKEFYGQDFGTASPAATVGAKFDRNRIYARQINYKPMNALDIGKMYCTLKLTASDKIIADYADKNAILKLFNGWKRSELSNDDFINYPKLSTGFNIIKCIKGADSITHGISLITSLEVFVVEESTDFWNEIRNYVYAQDKNGNYTDDPIDDYNHCLDAFKYICTDQRGNTSDYKVFSQ